MPFGINKVVSYLGLRCQDFSQWVSRDQRLIRRSVDKRDVMSLTCVLGVFVGAYLES